MTLTNSLFMILGLVASGSFIYSNYVLNRNLIMLLQTAGSVAVSVQFAVVGIWGVAAVNGVFILRNIWLTVRERQLKLKDEAAYPDENLLWGLLTFLTLVPVYLFFNPLNAVGDDWMIWALPLAAAVGNILSIAQSQVVRLKIFMFAAVACWAAFDIITGAWTTLLGDTFSMFACLLAVRRIWKNAEQ